MILGDNSASESNRKAILDSSKMTNKYFPLTCLIWMIFSACVHFREIQVQEREVICIDSKPLRGVYFVTRWKDLETGVIYFQYGKGYKSGEVIKALFRK